MACAVWLTANVANPDEPSQPAPNPGFSRYILRAVVMGVMRVRRNNMCEMTYERGMFSRHSDSRHSSLVDLRCVVCCKAFVIYDTLVALKSLSPYLFNVYLYALSM